MTLEGLAAEVESLRANQRRDAARIHALEEYVDTVSSALYKRLWWTLQGYRFRRVGRWYRKTDDLK